MLEKPSIFTPSNTSPELLEKMFVQRHKLLDKSVRWTKESILTEKKNHLIYIGPRGSGKTHFITMLINRIKRDKNIKNKMVIVWLGEDSTVTSFLDLVLSILQKMVKDNQQQYNADCLNNIQSFDNDKKAKVILKSIEQQIGNKTIVLIKENINQVFHGLKDAGQKSLRSYLQEQNNMVLVCTSQLLFKAISSREAVFFGFFDTYHLEPLKLNEAIQLVIKIAQHQDNLDLIKFLKTAQGTFRMRALHYLAGGNHRLYIELVDFLTAESLDNLVDAIYDLIETLTPYFQERINSLPPQQQRIIQELCKAQGAIPVKELAEKMIIIEERTLAKQLGELKKINYVNSHKRGKQSFYEISEPLMRLSEEVKNSHGKPLKLISSLLRAWFSDEDLQTKIATSEDRLLFNYKQAALDCDKKILIDLNEIILEEGHSHYKTNDFEAVIEKLSEIVCSPTTPGRPLEQKAIALFNRGITHGLKGEIKKEIRDYTELINLKNAPIELIAHALLNRGVDHGKQNNFEKAIQDYSKLINLKDASIELVAMALLNRGHAFGKQNKSKKAIQDYSKLINLKNAPIEQIANALLNRGFAFDQQSKTDKAIQDYSKLIDLINAPIEQVADALFFRGITLCQQGNIDRSIKDLKMVLKLQDCPQETLNNALFLIPELYYIKLNREKAHKYLENAFITGGKKEENYPSNITDILIAIINLGSKNWQDEITWILKLFDNHEVLEFLGAGLIKATSAFVEDSSLLSSLQKWQKLWQKSADEYEEMQIPLHALKVSRLAIEQKSDKPLFELFLETRQLVKPIIEKLL